MQSAKGRASPKESPQKVSPRPARQLKINPVEHKSSPPSSNTARTPKDKSPKVTERRSPRSPICEKKRPNKLSELESQISKLHNDLKTVKDQLIASESSKKEAQADTEDGERQLSDVSLKLDKSKKQLSELCASKNASVINLQDISQEDQDRDSKLEAVRQKQLDDSTSLNSAVDEIQRLKQQLEKVSELEETSSLDELESLKNNLAETSSLVESMKHELEQVRESEAQAQNVIKQTLAQLEAAKDTINALRSDIVNSTKAYNSVASELQQSRARVSFLECFVNNLKKVNSDQKSSLSVHELEMELQATKFELKELRSALEAAEIRFNEERSHSGVQIRSAAAILDQIKAQFSVREAELEEELKKATADIDELKASLLDKETELQGISEENGNLESKLDKDQELGIEVMKLREHVTDMKVSLTDKETELQNILENNEMLKLEMGKQEMDKGFEANQIAAELEASRAAEQEALTKIGYMMEEVEKSNRKVVRVAEQLETAQAANADMEAELRRLKVQSDQWRKAAEAAASMLSPGNNEKYVERTGSVPLSPYLDEYDDDSFKKKNGNVLKKIGVLWKKPQK